MKIISWVVLLLIIFIFSSFEINENKNLFLIERSKDSNQIYYDINVDKNNQLNLENPVSIYWVKVSKNLQKEPLTWVQNKYAYGIKYIKLDKNEAKFHFVSYKNRIFTVRNDSKGNYKVFTHSGNKEVEVKKIFIKMDGGSFWVPKISKVELHAIENISKNKIIETIIP